MINKLLIVCGPTATGKTSLAISLAKNFSGEIISADSRQVYKGMDIGTGKDLPANSKLQTLNSKLGFRNLNLGFYFVKSIKLWGYDLIDPRKDFSVAQFVKFAKKTIEDIQKRDKLPILTGGTGLYIKGVVDGISTISIPRNRELRKSLSDKSPGQLFEILAQLDSLHAASMNLSDKKNPRRLIRAIEIAMWKLEVGSGKVENGVGSWSSPVLFIGLTAPRETLAKKIDERVDKRIKRGMEAEVKKLLDLRVSKKSQAMASLGYKQFVEFFENKKTKEDAISDWRREEKNYAKRQMTWFKKDKRIKWFDIMQKNYTKKVENLVKKWYIST